MHWADVIAKDVVDNCDHPLIATGISPTGILHVGSLREAITGESIRSAVEATGADVKLIYIIDDFDPLRKRYPFLPEEYEKYVGMPICRIPCPCGKHNNYAHHFVQPFLDTIETLGMHCEVIWTHELYEKGKFAPWIDKAITKREEVRGVIFQSLQVLLTRYNVVLDSLQIADLNFSARFNNAIEEKMIAEQEALKAKNVLERVRTEAEQQLAKANATAAAKVLLAEAEAKAIKLQADVIKENGGNQYLLLKAIERWDGRAPTTLLGGKGDLGTLLQLRPEAR